MATAAVSAANVLLLLTLLTLLTLLDDILPLCSLAESLATFGVSTGVPTASCSNVALFLEPFGRPRLRGWPSSPIIVSSFPSPS